MDLSGNNIGGVVTEELFANLISLEEIYLANNSLKVVVDPEWRPPFSLTGASFASCHMGPLFPAWLKWQVDLSYLDISRAGITDKLPDWFCTSFANVTTMIVSENGINGSLPTKHEGYDIIKKTLFGFKPVNWSNTTVTGRTDYIGSV
jgi:hypothetical protein